MKVSSEPVNDPDFWLKTGKVLSALEANIIIIRNKIAEPSKFSRRSVLFSPTSGLA